MRILSTVVGITVALGLFGCPNPNTYASARTIPRDDLQVLVAAEGYAMIDDDGMGGTETQFVPSAPTIGVRYGVANAADVGLRAVNLSSVAFDTKVQIARGRIDLALDPGVQWHHSEIRVEDEQGNRQDLTTNVFDVNVPIVAGWNLGKRASLVVSPGVMLRTYLANAPDLQWFGVAGLGLNVRATRSFAVQPQVTGAWDLVEGGGSVVVGLGFTFGAQPTFDDLDPPSRESRTIAHQ